MLSSASFAEDSMLERIGKGAFFGCSALSGFVIPDSVSTIEEDAFSNCENVIWTEDGIPMLIVGLSIVNIAVAVLMMK